MRIIKLDESSKKNILNDLLKRSPNNYDNFADSVNAILANVKENGDKALLQYTKDFDKADINASNIKVTEEEILRSSFTFIFIFFSSLFSVSFSATSTENLILFPLKASINISFVYSGLITSEPFSSYVLKV